MVWVRTARLRTASVPPKALAGQVRQPVARIQPLDREISETIRLAQFFAIHPVNAHEITILPDLSDE